MDEKYIGIENELISFKGGEKFDFNKVFDKFVRKQAPCYRPEGEDLIRTAKGLCFYMDCYVPEINTPPVLINQGFATRLTDLLMIGREDLIGAFRGIKYTGYSMHWNLSSIWSMPEYIEELGPVFQLFGTTPLSRGMRLRDSGDRVELFGDSINNEDQINALSLLLGSYSIKREFERCPIQQKPKWGDLRRYKSRDNMVPLLYGRPRRITAQEYLEQFYEWLRPVISVLGTEKEIKNLNDFIFGNKLLDVDKPEYFKELKARGGKRKGIYCPVEITGKNESGRILKKKRGANRKLPIEGQLLGEIIKRRKEQLSSMDWDSIEVSLVRDPDDIRNIRGIRAIYTYARSLNRSLPKLEKCPKFDFE